jgi:hypothetical protein
VRTAFKILPFVAIIAAVACRETWSMANTHSFYKACTEGAIKWTGTDENAKAYCDCVFEKMRKRYPHADDALEHLDSLAIDPELKKCKTEMEEKLTR